MLEINICDVFLFDDIHSDIILRTVNFVVRACRDQSMSLYSVQEIPSILMSVIYQIQGRYKRWVGLSCEV